ncbi:MAG: hypothetical protein A2176_15560 [Spirochaetes bacterium RBG_13_51_14]|nr:MAG: hypothetical protein A2176_15560 [Spirochaetes bacterium RBG_13_51_14]
MHIATLPESAWHVAKELVIALSIMVFKKFSLLITVASAAAIIASPIPAFAVDISFGGTVKCNWWKPAWNNGRLILYPPDNVSFIDTYAPKYPVIQNFMYGPDLSIQFLRGWETAISFRYGQASTKGGNMSIYPGRVYRIIRIDIKEYDIYANLGYYILDFLKLYGGLRVEVITYKNEYDHVEIMPLVNMFHINIEGQTLNVIPEIGISLSAPLSRFFTPIFNCSAAFLSGSEKTEYKNSYDQSGPQLNFSRIPAGRYYAVGGTASLSLKITIPRTDASVGMGAYYRILRYIQKTTDRGIFDLDASHDHNYGLFCSVSYSISFDERKKRRVWIPRPSYD